MSVRSQPGVGGWQRKPQSRQVRTDCKAPPVSQSLPHRGQPSGLGPSDITDSANVDLGAVSTACEFCMEGPPAMPYRSQSIHVKAID